MKTPSLHFFFDFTDPLSYLVARQLGEFAGTDLPDVVWMPFELRPPPSPLVTLDDEDASERWATAFRHAATEGIEFHPPQLVPWTRKAHELALHGEEKGVAELIRARVFEAYMSRGLDIGRVDVLLEIGSGAGLDLTETKAVLDVDRFEAGVLEARSVAYSENVGDTPTLLANGRQLKGFHNRAALGTFLRA